MQIKLSTLSFCICLTVICIAYVGMRYRKIPAADETRIYSAASWNVSGRNSVEVVNSTLNAFDVILNSYMRSGSTVTGKILSKRDDCFYLFEPLWKVSKCSFYKSPDLFCDYFQPSCINIRANSKQVKEETDVRGLDESLNYLRSIFSCSFHRYSHYFIDSEIRGQPKDEHDWVFYKGAGWEQYKTCRDNKEKFLSDCLKEAESGCRAAKHRIVKVLRMTLDNMESLLLSNDRLKVIHLFRDPRGILNSQLQTSWIPVDYEGAGSINDSITVMCERILMDIQAGKKLERKFPDRVKLVRYEELGDIPKVAKALYAFLGMSYTTEQEKIVQRFTVPKKTSKGAKGFHPFDNRSTLSWNIIRTVDKKCADVLDQLGYTRYSSETEFRYTPMTTS